MLDLRNVSHAEASDRFRALPRGSVALLLGDVDTGKSTLTKSITTAIGFVRAGIVDSDIGQGTLAPPGAIGAAIVENGKAETVAACFIGAVNPTRHMADLCDGVASLLAVLRAGDPDIIVIDTDGLVRGRIGASLKMRLIRSIHPDIVVALARSAELNSILDCVSETVWRLAVSPRVGKKSSTFRRRARAKRFAAALAGSRPVEFAVDGLLKVDLPIGLLTGLLDSRGFLVGIGRFESADGSAVSISTPVDPDRVAAIQFGGLVVAPSGLATEAHADVERRAFAVRRN